MIPLEMLLLIAAMVYGVIIAMRLSLAFPASLAENLTARAALSRSGKLTQGAKGRIFLVLLVIYALGYAAEMVGIIVLVVVIGIGALVMAACGVQLPSVAGILGIVLASLCFAAFLYLWMSLLWSAFSTSFAVLYHDQRLRKDGFLPVPSQAGESPA
jgi:membrane-anchored glycerophosphoryl diester phosphodiesterase (GDPDase)